MDNITNITDAPLTRRQAREIERRTGVRPVAPSQAFRHDTGEIVRNEMTALVSVLPTELVERIAEPVAPREEIEIPAAFDGRSLTVRAAVPATIVAQRRRRTAASFAAAAAVTAVASVGLASANTGEVVAAEYQANLLTANTPIEATDEVVDTAAQTDSIAPAAPVEVTEETTSVETFDSSSIMAVAEASVAPATSTVTETTSNESSSNVSSESSTPTAASGNYSVPAANGSGIVATAYSWVGSGIYGHGTTPDGWDCAGFVQYVFAQNGISLPWGVGSQAAMGTVVSDPQPGDLVIFGGYHVAIYVGDGMMIDSPDWGRSVELGGLDAGSSYYFVRI